MISKRFYFLYYIFCIHLTESRWSKPYKTNKLQCYIHTKYEVLMKFNKLGIIFLVISFIFSKEKEQSSTSASMGSVTLDGKIYNQVAIRPEIPIGKLGIGLDLYLYFNDEGLYPGNWDFSDGNAYSTLIDKIYYLRWGKPSEKLYFMLGALPNATLGQGILVNNYSNIMEYPQVRRIGLDFKMKFMKKFSLEFIHSNFKKSAPGVLARTR